MTKDTQTIPSDTFGVGPLWYFYLSLAVFFGSSWMLGVFDIFMTLPPKSTNFFALLEWMITGLFDRRFWYVGFTEFFHLAPLMQFRDIYNSKNAEEQYKMLESLYDLSTASAVFESIMQGCIATIYLMDKLASDSSVSLADQTSVIVSVAISGLSVALAIYRLDRVLAHDKEHLFQFKPNLFRDFNGKEIKRKKYHKNITLLHRWAELSIVCGPIVLGFGVLAVNGQSSNAYNAGIILAVLEISLTYAALLYIRCTHSSSGGGFFVFFTTLFIGFAIFFVNPIDKMGCPLVPWNLYNGYRTLLVFINWCFFLSLAGSAGTVTTSPSGRVTILAAVQGLILWPLTTYYMARIRDLAMPSTFWRDDEGLGGAFGPRRMPVVKKHDLDNTTHALEERLLDNTSA